MHVLLELLSLLETVEPISKGKATAEYWAGVFQDQNPNRSSWDANLEEVEAALLDGAKYKFIVRTGKKIVAAIAFNLLNDSVHVEHLGSLSSGSGTLLMKRVEQFATRKKLPVTLVPSEVAVGFYKKLGYQPTGQGDLWKK